jgi:hypothetical protein
MVPVRSIDPGRRIAAMAAFAVALNLLILLIPAMPALARTGYGPVPQGYVFNSRCAPISISPHLVGIGGTISAHAGPRTDACGGPADDVDWQWGLQDGTKVVSGCGDTASTCVVKAVAATNAWVEGCLDGGSDFGGWSSCDYYGVLPKGQHDLSGTISANRASGKSVAGQTVAADGPGGRQTTTTDARGTYTFAVKDGTYTVTPSAATSPVRRTVTVTRDTTGVDFELTSDELALHFSPGSVTADGLGHFEGTATDTKTGGSAVAGQALSFTPPLDVRPRALVCSPSGLVYPTVLNDGSPLGSHFELTTDQAGSVPLAVWVGTQSGDWLLQAAESDDGRTNATTSLSFGDTSAASFSPGLIPRELGTAVGLTIGGSGINLFKDFGAIGQSQASNQAVLLAFLRTVTGRFPGADYGPVHGGGTAGIVFYRHGTADPSSGAVMSIDQAADIVDAVGTGKPIPAADESLPTLGVWASEHSTTPAAALGSLNAPPQEELEYFGFPYPPPVTSATAQVSFYGPCLAPDPSLQEIQTHSPVRLSFTGPNHYQFGLGANGKHAGGGSGLIERSGDVTTYAIPRGSYTMQVTATGKGPATIVMLSPAKRTQTVQSVSLTVRKGQSGNLALGPGGVAGPLRLGAKSVRASKGLPLTLKGVPRTLRAKHRARIQLTLTSFGAPIANALVTASGKARAAAVTNQRGAVRLSLTPTSKGKVSLTISVPGSGALRRQIRVR